MKKLNLLKVLISLLGVFAFFSCEIGLGESVDTEVPTVEITTVESGAIIRDKFRIGGTWQDDGKIDEITIGIKRQGTSSKETISFSANVNKGDGEQDQIWYRDFDPVGADKLIDGNYDIEVLVRDTVGHKSSQKCSITIDNTPPVIVLQRPGSTVTSDGPDSYGQSFTLEGQAADDNNVSLIEVKIYSDSECTDYITTVELKNVPNTINMDVAKFESGKHNDYSKIYGEVITRDELNKAKEKPLYCKIIAYDGAKRYPINEENALEDDEKGNCATEYYLYEEISSEVLNENRITDVYSMFNGTYVLNNSSDSSRAAESAAKVDEVKQILESKKISKGYFSLNPANNPTFTVSGRKPLQKDGNDFQEGARREEVEITNGTKVQIEIATGLDGIPIDEDTLGIYVIECDSNGVPKAGAEKLTVVSQKTDKNGNLVLTDATEIAKRKELIAKSGTSRKITATLDAALVKGLKVGGTYIFGVLGCDQNGTDVSDFGDTYGFYLAANGAAPKLNITNPANGISYKAKGNDVSISGYATTELSYPDVTIKVIDEDNNILYRKEYVTKEIANGTYPVDEITASIPDGVHRVDFTHVIPVDAFSQTESKQYTITVDATNGDKQTTLDRTIIYDVEGPAISIDSVYPEADKYKRNLEDGSKEDGKYLNGEVSLKIAIVDAYDVVNKDAPVQGAEDHRPYFEIVDSTGTPLEFKLSRGTVKNPKTYITSPAKQEFTIDTTSIVTGAETKDVKIRVHAWDRAGNKGDVYEVPYTIDQSTDVPFIYPNDSESLTLTYENKDDIRTALANSIFKSVLTSGSSLTIKLADDDGIGNYKFEIGEKDNADETLLKVPEVCDTKDASGYTNTGISPNGNPTDIIFTYSLPTISGSYLCRMTVTDNTEAKNSYSKKFWIQVTGAAPDVTVTTTPANKIISLDANAAVKEFSNVISINSVDEPFTIIRSQKTGAATVIEDPLITGWKLSDGDFTDTFEPAASRSENKVTYIVVDKYDHKGSREVSYDIDSTKPVIDDTSIVVPGIDKTQLSSFRFTASASDTAPNGVTPAEKSSGIAKMQYTFTAGDKAEADIDNDNIMTINGATSLSQTVVFNDDSGDTNKGFDYATEGVKKIWIRAVDDVGNKSTWVSKKFMFDKADPTVQINKYNNTAIPQSAALEFETSDKFALKGTASDSNGVASIQIWQKKSGTTYTAGTNTAADKGILIKTIANPVSGAEWTIENLPRVDTVEGKDNLDADANGVVSTGTYVYTVIVTDKAGFEGNGNTANTVKKDVTVKIDTQKPSFTFSLSDNNTDSTAYGENSLSGSEYTFRGNASDPVDGNNYCSGVAKVYYGFTKTNSAPATWNNASVNGNAWSIPTELKTGTGTEDGTATLYEGKHYLYVKVEDNAGNVSDAAYISFMVDQKAPEFTTYEVWEKRTGGDVKATLNAADNSCNVTNTNTTGYYLKGTVADANGIKTLKINNSEVTVTSGNWQSSVYTTQEVKNFTIEVVDNSGNNSISGKKKTLNTTVIYDNVAPVFANISADATKNANLTWVKGTGSTYFNGEVTENGSGLKSLMIQIVPKGSTKIDSNYKTLALTSSWSYSYTIPTGLTENDETTDNCNSLWVKAIDNAGNTTEKEYFFRYDKEAPKASISIDKTYINATNTVTLSGYAHDGRGASAGRALKTAKITVTNKAGTTVKTIDLLDATTGSAYGYVTTAGTTYGNFSKAIQGDFTTDDEYTFTLDVVDFAGNPKQEVAKVTVDKTAPTTTLTGIPGTTTATAKWYGGTTAYFSGSATENGSGISTIKVKFDDEADSAYRSVAATKDWGYNFTIPTGFAENTKDSTSNHKIIVQIVDNAGNTSKTEGYFHYDRAAPKGTISADKAYVSGDNEVTLSGKVYDNEDGKTYRPVDAASITINGTSYPIDPSAPDGSYTLKIKKDKFTTDGTYTCVLSAKDYMGNSLATEPSVTVTVDTQKPEITAIDDLDEAATTAAYWIEGIGNATFSGSAKDETNGSGLDKIKIKVDDGAEIDVAPGTSWSKTVAKSDFAENDRSASSVHKLTVWAVDKAGNRSTDKVAYFRYDKGAPEASISIDKTYINATNTVTLSGYAHDGRGASAGRALKTAKITVTNKAGATVKTIDLLDATTGSAYGYVTTAGTTYGNFRKAIQGDFTTDDEYTFILDVEDFAGNTKQSLATVTVDKTAPIVSIDADSTKGAATDDSLWVRGTVAKTFTGTASSDVKVLKIKVDGTEYSATAGEAWSFKLPATVVAALDESTDASAILPASPTQAQKNAAEAVKLHTINAYVEDIAGNISNYVASTERYFRYDKAEPTLGLSSSGEYVNGNSGSKVTLRGNAYDGTRGVKSLVLSAYPSTAQGYSTTSSKDITINPQANGNYSVDLTTANITTDGKYKIVVIAKDYAGDEVSESTIVTVDKVAPTGTTGLADTPDYLPTVESVEQKWFKSSQITVKLTGITETTSGIESVEAKAIKAGTTDANPTTGLSTLSKKEAGGVTYYEGKVTAAVQGKNQINFRLTDKAGNIKTISTLIAYVDTDAPDTADFTLIKVDGESGTGYTTKLTNRGSDVVVIMDLKDKNELTPIASVRVNKENAVSSAGAIITTDGDENKGKWKLTIKKDDIPQTSGSLGIEVKDSVGNSVIYTPFSFKVDTKDPDVDFGKIDDADTSSSGKVDINKVVTIPINASDDQELDSVTLKYSVGTTEPSNWANVATTIPVTKTATGHTATIDTVSLGTTANEKNLYLKLTAKDKAGNSKDSTTNVLYINQDSDRPVVKFTNLLKDESGNFVLKYGDNSTLEGTVIDDDSTSTAAVKQFVASGTECTVTTNASGTTITGATGTTTYTPTTGDFKFKPAATGDGAKTVYFYIVDNNDNVFTTKKTDSKERPFQQFKTDAKVDNNAAITYMSDGNAPKINNISLQAWYNSTGTADTDKNGSSSLGSNCIVGGTTKKYVDIAVSAKDENGIKGITIELTGEKNGSPVKQYYRSNNLVEIKDASTYTETQTIVKTTNDSSNHEYTTKRIDLSAFDAGEVKVKVYIYDNAGLYANSESLFVVDNTAPTLGITTYDDGDVVYGTNKISIGGAVNGATDVDKIYYAVTEKIASNTIADADWTEITGSKITATVVFNGTASDNGQVSDSLREWLKTVYEKDEDYMMEHDDNLDLRIHFKAVDECGNAGYSYRDLEVIPNGDKPIITLSYPVDKEINGALEHPSLAGTIRVYGNAEVGNGSVKAIYVQIDTAYNGTFNASGWEEGFNSCISGKQDLVSYKVEAISNSGMRGIKATGTLNWNLPINGNKEFDPASGSGTRKVAVRIYGVGGSGKVSEPVTQVFDIDPSAPHIGGDGTIASVMPLMLVQLNASGAVTNKIPYQSGTWVKGEWYIAASVYDDSGIKTITLDDGESDTKTIIVNNSANNNGKVGTKDIIVRENDCRAAINNVTGKKNFDIYIPLPTSTGSGTVNYTIEAEEVNENANRTTENIKVNFDNTPPKIGTADHTDAEGNNDSNVSPKVENDNGFYRIYGYTTDADTDGGLVSDIKAIAFYFVRRGAENTRVYDPMWKNKFKAIQTVTNSVATDVAGISYDYGMFWNAKTVGRDSTDLKKLTLTTADDNIHAGGFVMLGGNIYTIKTVSADGKTITLKTEAPLTETSAKFAYAMVIDNFNNTESVDGRDKETDPTKYGYGYYKEASASSNQDDGDLMQEKYNNGKWEAWVNSKNIPDGPIEIHYVVLDNALNYSVGIVGNLSSTEYTGLTRKTLDVTANGTPVTAGDANKLASGFYYSYDANNKANISNNAPRIAGVTVGTDYDGNGTISDSEKVTKYVSEQKLLFSGKEKAVATGVTSKFIASTGTDAGKSTGNALMAIKSDTSVEVELIGGNNNIYYQYSFDGETYKEHSAITNFTKVNTAMSITREDEGKYSDADFGAEYYKSTTLPAITFTESAIKSAINANKDKYWFTFEFWDETEETTKFSSSQYAELKLPLSVQVYDNISPNTVFNDLYWNSASDNSVYKDVNGKLYGHIELKKDYENAANDSTMVTTYGKDDDKVSGIIKFSGYAYDNKKLSKLRWGISTTKGKVGNKDADNTDSTNAEQVWPQKFVGDAEYTVDADTNVAGWSTSGDSNIGNPYYYFKVYDDAEHGAYLNGDGHKVYWELTVDTSHVQEPGKQESSPWSVGKNLYVWVRAEDSSENKTNMNPTVKTDGTDAQNISPNYKVDIVPYITGVTTRLAKANSVDPTSYSRTAKGHYPIDEAEGNITLSGYNLAVDNADVTIAATSVAALTSGAYVYSTGHNSIVSINNMNNNDAHGDYDISVTGLSEANKVKNMYNRVEAYNSNTNLKLTDDVYFDVWDLNNRAAVADGALQYPVMHINPSNNQIGFGFAKGGDSISFPTNDYSYRWFQKNNKDYTGTNFVYDSNGYAHTISIGMDSQNGSGVAGRMLYINSHWWANNDGSSKGVRHWDQRYNVALESVMIPNGIYVKGTQTNVANDVADNVSADRYPSTPAIAVAEHTVRGNKVPTVYIMYYDYVHEQLRFRYGTVNTTTTSRATKKNNGTVNNNSNNDIENYTVTQFDLLNDSKSERQRHSAGYNTAAIDDETIDIDVNTNGDNYNNHSAFEASKSYYALVAGDYYKQTNDGLTGTAGSKISETGNKAGQYYALDVVPGTNVAGDKVVMVWYADHKLYMTYRTNISGSTDNTDARAAGRANGNTIQWKPTATLMDDPTKSLKDIAMKVDADGGIHIIAGDATNADLNYIYLPNADWMYASTGNALDSDKKPYSCVVDSYSLVGDIASIDTVKNADGNVVPYISYYASGFGAKPKVAFLPNGIDSTATNYGVTAGADSESKFTGDWEISLIPTASELRPDNNKVNIGLWRDGNGKIKSDNTGTDDTGKTYERKRYCNGNSGVVLGYGIREGTKGFMETAMYKGMPTYE